MKALMGAAAIAVASVITVGALVGDQLEQRLAGAGKELQSAVAVAGQLQIAITTLTESDVVRNKEEISRRIVDLKEQTDRIGVPLSSLENKGLELKGLNDRDRVVFLNFVSSATNKVLSPDAIIDIESIRQSYFLLQKNLLFAAYNYEGLLKEFRPSLSPFSQRRLGLARSDLTISLGQLVEFSGFVMKMAYAMG
jgi:ABC-type antimicrobial peptide transport system permease subunit